MQTLNVQLVQNEMGKTNEVVKKSGGRSGASFGTILESVQSNKPTDNAKKTERTLDNVKPESSIEEKPVAEERSVENTVAESGSPEKTAGEKSSVKKSKDNEKEADGKSLEAEMNVKIDVAAAEDDNSVFTAAFAEAQVVVPSDNAEVQVPVENLDTEIALADVSKTEENAVGSSNAEIIAGASTPDAVLVESAYGEIGLADDSEIKIPETAGEVAEEEIALAGESGAPAVNEESKEKDSALEKALASTDAGREEKPLYTVVDQRTKPEEENKIASADEKTTVRSVPQENADVTGQVARNIQANILSSDNQSAGATGSNFQQMLTQQIQENAPEFVKAGTIVLKDNNSGSINLILKPENLGNVKISLQLSDKVIGGEIVVHSKEAFEAFKQNLDTLKQAFQNNGFDNASFNLSLSENSTGSSFAQERQNDGDQYMANKTYGNYSQSEEDPSSASDSAAYTKSGDYQVDVVA